MNEWMEVWVVWLLAELTLGYHTFVDLSRKKDCPAS